VEVEVEVEEQASPSQEVHELTGGLVNLPWTEGLVALTNTEGFAIQAYPKPHCGSLDSQVVDAQEFQSDHEH
jgi:hypothetical protein